MCVKVFPHSPAASQQPANSRKLNKARLLPAGWVACRINDGALLCIASKMPVVKKVADKLSQKSQLGMFIRMNECMVTKLAKLMMQHFLP